MTIGHIRRSLWLALALAALASLPLAGGIAQARAVKKDKSLPTPNRSGIQHIVVVMMENRSFDHLLGWLPNADGMQAGLTYVDAGGVSHATAPLAPDYMGCSHPDPDHSWE